MLRIRFHGRGGQGMKTASRILGAAAFHAGYVVQDAPVYGAERRGAPMAAFTRIAHAPILERGAIVQADLVVVADDTLLTEPAAQPLAGCESHGTVLVNSTRDEAALRHTTSHSGRLLVADGTALALALTQTLAGLSTAMGIAAAHLVGLSLEDSLAGLHEELDEAQLNPAQREANLHLARRRMRWCAPGSPIQEDGERGRRASHAAGGGAVRPSPTCGPEYLCPCQQPGAPYRQLATVPAGAPPGTLHALLGLLCALSRSRDHLRRRRLPCGGLRRL